MDWIQLNIELYFFLCKNKTILTTPTQFKLTDQV